MYEPTINYFAVIVATFAHYLLGGLWYSPALFLNQWLDGMGITKEEAKDKSVGGYGIGLLYQFLGTLVLVFVTAHMVDIMKVVYHDLSNLTVGLTSSFWLWLGYIFTFGITGVVFEKHSWKLFGVNMGYQFTGLMIVGSILVVWV
jgi:hypothetical protein